MDCKIQKTSKYKSKLDNEYFDITINGITHERLEKSEVRQLIGVLDKEIHH